MPPRGCAKAGTPRTPFSPAAGFFYVVFLQAFRARKPRRDLEQNLVAKKRDRGIPRSRNLLEPTACRGNTAATRKKGGTVIDGLRVPARADQEITRSRNPQIKKFQIEKSRMQRRRRGEQKGERGAVSARSGSGHPQLEKSCGFGRQRHEADRCGFEARTSRVHVDNEAGGGPLNRSDPGHRRAGLTGRSAEQGKRRRERAPDRRATGRKGPKKGVGSRKRNKEIDEKG